MIIAFAILVFVNYSNLARHVLYEIIIRIRLWLPERLFRRVSEVSANFQFDFK